MILYHQNCLELLYYDLKLYGVVCRKVYFLAITETVAWESPHKFKLEVHIDCKFSRDEAKLLVTKMNEIGLNSYANVNINKLCESLLTCSF